MWEWRVGGVEMLEVTEVTVERSTVSSDVSGCIVLRETERELKGRAFGGLKKLI